MTTEETSHTYILLKRIHESDFPSEKVFLTAAKDNQKFPIHTIVLAASSKYFTASLGPNFQDGEKEEFVLEGADAETVKAIVDYCYTGLIELTEENVGKFIAIASSVQLDMLETVCRRFYEEKLCVTNCVDALVVADRYNYVGMRQRAFDLICGGLDKVPAADFQKLEHRLIQEILKSDEIQASEDLVFKRLLKWFQYDEMKRAKQMPELLRSIRLEHITIQLLNSTLEMFFGRFFYTEIIRAEYKRRASTPCSNIGFCRFRSIFCLFIQYKGENGAEQSTIKMEKLNLVLNTCEEAGEIALGERSHFGVIMLKNKIFVLGGYLNGEYLKTASAFDMNTGEEEILPEMNSARGYMKPLLHGKYIYAFGGYGLNSCERFDIETKTWNTIKEMNHTRYDYSVTLLNEYLCVAGGVSRNQVEMYDPTKDEWSQLAAMNEVRSNFAMIQTHESLYAIGGNGVIERNDSWKNRWAKVGSFTDSGNITSAINIDGDLYVIMRNGQYGRITINGSGEISFARLGQSKYEWTNRGRHFLFWN